MQNIKYALTVDEAAAYTGIGKNTIRQLIAWKKLPVLKIGRRILIQTEKIEELIKINTGRDLRKRENVIAVGAGEG